MLHKILTAALLILFYSSNAQQAPIAIVSASGTTRLTSTLDSAKLLAETNDIIYLPGGNFTGMSDWFTKKVTVIGVGHNPDSTSATGRTYVDGSIGFYPQAAGSIIDGVYLSGNIYVTTNNKVYRCNASIIYSPWNFANVDNLIADQCVIRVGVRGYPGVNAMYGSIIKNSIINSGADFTSGVNTTTFENCVFLTQGAYGIEQANQCTFRNNTFTGITSWGNASNSFFYNNVFSSIGYPPLLDSSNAIGNIVNQTTASTFSPTPTLPTPTYTYDCDYKINPTNTQVLNGGTGGTQIGIYGGTSPWAKGNIPPNPHIRTKNVDAATGAGGTLRVRFNVGVQ